MRDNYEAIVIGSGFGGAILGCRLAKKWPGGNVLIFERGKRYPMGSFPRSPHDIARNFWSLSNEKTRRPKHVRKMIQATGENFLGMFDVRNYHHMDVVIGAGFGGGSLIYANVFLILPEDIFDDRWPGSCKRSRLWPYYEIARQALGSRPIPRNDDPRRRIMRTELFEDVARRNGRDAELVDINVFFGNDFRNPLPIGKQERNRYGALQTSCVYCAECVIGCNYHAKNTLDLNYLYVGEHRYQAEIRTEHLVSKIVPVSASGADDPDADGSHGYRVYYRDLCSGGQPMQAALAKRVVVSAGTLGTTELLLRSKEYFRTLPRISDRLGHFFSGNGDFLSFVWGSKFPVDPTYGPTITQRTDYYLFHNFDPNRAFILEDASFPAVMAWFIEGVTPRFLRVRALLNFLRDWKARLTSGKSLGRVAWAFSDILRDAFSYRTCILLCMGADKSDGVMRLDENHELAIKWPYKKSLPLYRAILEAGKQFRSALDASVFAPLPTWDWPVRNNITVHPVGGCILANDSSRGVTSADPKSFGQVFGYNNLYVADGSLIPAAVGANPTATISALSEIVAQGITGLTPDASL